MSLDKMDTDTIDILNQWTHVSQQLKQLKSQETELRRQLFTSLFPQYQPGDKNEKLELDAGWSIKGEQKLSYSVDKTALPAVLEQMPEGTESLLIRYKPELNMAEYKRLTEEQRLKFDQALVIKPATPTIMLVPPKG